VIEKDDEETKEVVGTCKTKTAVNADNDKASEEGTQVTENRPKALDEFGIATVSDIANFLGPVYGI
jgi:hypothetical protein